MLSLQQFRRHAYPMFELMKHTGHTFEIVHKGKVYDLVVRRTAKKPQLTRAKVSHKTGVVHAIDVQNCPNCDDIMFAGICMNKNCAQ